MFNFVLLFGLIVQDSFINLSNTVKKNSLPIMSISGVTSWFLSKEPSLRSTVGIISIYLVFITVLATAIINWIKLYKTFFSKTKEAVPVIETIKTIEDDDTADFTGQNSTKY